MSAVTPAATVEQLAQALQPHPVLVHHDFSQVPDFALSAPNVSFVPDPRRTGWATFGFVEGIFHALRHALDHLAFDYVQLLSPTCLPIKPMAAFEAHVAHGVDAHFGAIDLLADPECFMSVGYRAFTPQGTLRHRVLRRLCAEYFGHAPQRRDEQGVWIHGGGGRRWPAHLAHALTRLASWPAVGGHPFDETLRPYYGSVWFGARRHVVRHLVDGFSQPRLHDWASRMRISEEFLVPSLLARGSRTRGAINHFISRFDQAHPRRLDVEDLPVLRAAPAFFARKFPDDPHAPVRLRTLGELASAQRGADLAGVAGELPHVQPAGAGAVQDGAGLPSMDPLPALRAAT